MKIDINHITPKSLINMKINQIRKIKLIQIYFFHHFSKKKQLLLNFLRKEEFNNATILIFCGWDMAKR